MFFSILEGLARLAPILIFISFIIDNSSRHQRKAEQDSSRPQPLQTEQVEEDLYWDELEMENEVGFQAADVEIKQETFDKEAELAPREENSMLEEADALYEAEEAASYDYYNSLEFNDDTFDDEEVITTVEETRPSSHKQGAFNALQGVSMRQAVILKEILDKPKALHK